MFLLCLGLVESIYQIYTKKTRTWKSTVKLPYVVNIPTLVGHCPSARTSSASSACCKLLCSQINLNDRKYGIIKLHATKVFLLESCCCCTAAGFSGSSCPAPRVRVDKTCNVVLNFAPKLFWLPVCCCYFGCSCCEIKQAARVADHRIICTHASTHTHTHARAQLQSASACFTHHKFNGKPPPPGSTHK